MASSIYYGPRSYEGFASAFASRHRLSVSVSGSGQGAYVDAAGVINLPGIHGYQTVDEFEATCGTIIHEIAHVKYGSHTLFYSHRGKPRLWMDCLNAVVDIADEEAIALYEAANGNTRVGELLIKGCIAASRQNDLKPNPYRRKPNNAPAHWRILASGIIRSRCYGKGVKGANVYGDWLKTEFPAIDIAKVFRIMAGCRMGLQGRMTQSQLVSQTDLLYALLKSIAPPEGSPETPMPPRYGTPCPHGSPGGPVGGPKPGKGVSTLPQGATEASESEGAVIGLQGTGQAGGGAGNQPAQPTTPATMDRDCYDTMLPIVRRIAQRLANDGEAIHNEGGYSAGTGVRDAYRIATDGQCMGRWQMDPHADGMAVAVLLDCSGSMEDDNLGRHIAMPAGIAEAFAAGMEECAVVNRWEFSGYADSAREVASFDRAAASGGTPTDVAIGKAREWLATQTAGQKIIVCITDGAPGNPDQCKSQVSLAISEGVKVIGVALGGSNREREIYDSMPMATIVHAADANRLAIALEGITLQI